MRHNLEYVLAALGNLGEQLVLFKNALLASPINANLRNQILSDLDLIFEDFCNEVKVRKPNILVMTDFDSEPIKEYSEEIIVRIEINAGEVSLDISKFLKRLLCGEFNSAIQSYDS